MKDETKKTRSKKYEIETEENVIEIEETETKEKKEHPILRKIITSIIFIIILFLVYSFLICPSLFIVKEYKVSSTDIPNSFDGLKIVHFSDIHYGTRINKKQLDKIIKKINEIKPDIVFFTGDLIDKNIISTDEIKKEITSSLQELKSINYKYAVVGNEDDDNTFKTIMESANFKVLNNETTLLYYKENTPIAITGFNIIDSNPKYSILNDKVDNIEINKLYNIVLFHESNGIDNIINYNPDLVLSSGTLGGKVNIVKPLFLSKNNDKYYEDYYKINNTDYYISNGLGTTDVNFRFNNNPSINFYRLYKEEN